MITMNLSGKKNKQTYKNNDSIRWLELISGLY